MFWKQGDDLSRNIEEVGGNIIEGLRGHSEQMKGVSKILDEVADFIVNSEKQSEFSIDADTHMIMISGPDDLMDELSKRKLIQFEEELEEVEEYEEDDNDGKGDGVSV